MEIDYYPFKTAWNDLTVNDLIVLKDIPESWYIEYKLYQYDKGKVAKELCSLANQNGGYIFFGIDEKSGKGKNRAAGEFVGIPNADVENQLKIIEDAANVDCQPPVRIDIKVLAGLGNELGMNELSSLIIVRVPKSYQTPHIHSSGVILQRISESNQQLKDQLELQNLFLRKKEREERLKKSLSKRVPLNEENSNLPYIFVNILPRTQEECWGSPDFNLSNVSELLKKRHGLGVYVEFDYFSHIDGGIRFSQRLTNNPTNPTFALNLFYDGSARFDVPLYKNTLRNFHISDVNEQRLFEKFKSICNSQRFPIEAYCVDFSPIFISVMVMFGHYLNLAKSLGASSDFYVSSEIINIGYSIPYISTETFVELAEIKGVPFNFQDIVKRPSEFDEKSMKTTICNLSWTQNIEEEVEEGGSEGEQYHLLKERWQWQWHIFEQTSKSLMPLLIGVVGYEQIDDLFRDMFTSQLSRLITWQGPNEPS